MKKHIVIISAFCLLLSLMIIPGVLAVPPFPPNQTGVAETYGSGWNSDQSAPQKNDIYDYLHLLDTDDDGDIDTVDVTSVTIVDSVFIPIEWCLNGTTAPEAASVITSTNSVVIRNFASDQRLLIQIGSGNSY